jgi:hypothetical protein
MPENAGSVNTIYTGRLPLGVPVWLGRENGSGKISTPVQ